MTSSEVSTELGSRAHKLVKFLPVNYSIVWESEGRRPSTIDINSGTHSRKERVRENIFQKNILHRIFFRVKNEDRGQMFPEASWSYNFLD